MVTVAEWRRNGLEGRRKEIFRSLGLVLREQGLGALSMREIADRLGMTKSSLYYYFRNKQDLLYRCHLRCVRLSLAALARAERNGGRPGECLREVLTAHIRAITDEVYGAVILTDLESLTATQRGRYVALRDRFEQGVRRLIRAGIETGEFRPVDVRLVGFAILGAINWIPKWYSPKGELSAAEIAQAFADFLVWALEAPCSSRRSRSATSSRVLRRP